MKAKDFEEKFESGESIITDLDLSRTKRKNRDQKRVNVDFPRWMVESLDEEAGRLGVTRQSVIKMWVGERLDQMRQLYLGK